ncbi:MAG TPA: PIG-L deacetylase family protein [Armatimonadota bacterium]|jgi:LmbE family N-acetylglucosaminyl deacetylase
MTVLCIGAHPDDEISAGGTLAKHSQAGDRVVVITMTRGGMGHRTMDPADLVKLREKEAHEAAKTLGVELRLLDYVDGAVPTRQDVAYTLAAHIREIKPDVVLTHSDETFHPDHRATHRMAIDAVFAASLPLLDLQGLPSYNVPRVLLFADDLYRRHDVYVDIRDTIDMKIEAASRHASQYEDWLVDGGCAIDSGWDAVGYRDAFRMEGHIFGGHCGIEYAEAFDDLQPRGPIALPKLAI